MTRKSTPSTSLRQHARTVTGAQKFDEVAQSHRNRIFGFLMASTRDSDLAETLTQDCLVRAYRNWSGFRGESSPMTWMMRIAINVQKDYWRSRRTQFWRQVRMQAVDIDTARECLPSGAPPIDAQLVAQERMQEVLRVVRSLCEKQRTVFVLRYFEDLKLCEIAQVTGMCEGTVKAHLSRALRRVRSQVKIGG